MNDYSPNFNDPRIIKRSRKVLGFLLSQMNPDKPRELSSVYLKKIFGQLQNPLTDYLRESLLITTSHHFRFVSGPSVKSSKRSSSSYCKEYKRNESGINELINACGFIQSEFINASKMKKANTIRCLNLINPYCITSFKTEQDALKFALAMESAKYEFGSMLTSKKIPLTDKAGRLWGGTQQLAKQIKQQLHYEHDYAYEYDIEACAPTLLLQYAAKNGLNPKHSQHIQAYLDHKSTIREDLVFETGIDIKIIKKAINALFAGARLDKSIADEVNDPRKLRLLTNNKFIIALKQDIVKLWKVIKPLPLAGQRYKKDGTPEVKISSRTKWSVYFQLEREVLNVVLDYLRESKNDCIPEHDGWTTSKRVNRDELIKAIKDKTSYDVKIDEVELRDVVLVPM